MVSLAAAPHGNICRGIRSSRHKLRGNIAGFFFAADSEFAPEFFIGEPGVPSYIVNAFLSCANMTRMVYQHVGGCCDG